eukprot:TRINITY_DN17313_c0_g1_i1.p1 TRINITY_DN17313_c0_g1~~TRINITY_DN17313_c0_g1_i1.p1  ORF type:complete len:782 (-),score=154.41 TRINITY_DN17313_c0_g1_i1:14-2359(-)
MQHCPVYRPTLEEFSDPIAYIKKITPEAEKFGICRIQPPSSGKGFIEEVKQHFDKAVLKSNLRFRTKIQNLHQLHHRHGQSESFRKKLALYLHNKAVQIEPFPRLEQKEIDFYRLFGEVVKRGGFDEVVKKKKWAEIAKELRISPKCTAASHVLHRKYEAFLLDLEKSYVQHLTIKGLNFKGSINFAELNVVIDEMTSESLNCHVCNKDDDDPNMVMCDSCNSGTHIYCLNPPLNEIPSGEWFCSHCLDFGFDEGPEFSVDTFQVYANNFFKQWFGNKEPSTKEVEDNYWKIIESGAERVQVCYGSDIDTAKMYLGFPALRKENNTLMDLSDPSRASISDYWFQNITENGIGGGRGWNLNELPFLPDSLLKTTPDVAGITRPMLYIGMLFSSFCWHNEDNYLFSINYLHMGAPKTWYGVPGSQSEAFEEAMRRLAPEIFERQPDVLYHLITMVPPSKLRELGIDVYTTNQFPGDFMITFPRAYHAGFNHGFNCAESVNFATEDWLPYFRESVENYRLKRRRPVLSHAELIWSLVHNSPSPSILPKLLKELEFLREEEEKLRAELRNLGILVSRMELPLKIDPTASELVLMDRETELGPEKNKSQSKNKKRERKPKPKEKENRPQKRRVTKKGLVVASSTFNIPESIDHYCCSVCLCDLYFSAVICSGCDSKIAVCPRHVMHGCGCDKQKKKLVEYHSLDDLNLLIAKLSSRVADVDKPPKRSTSPTLSPPRFPPSGRRLPKANLTHSLNLSSPVSSADQTSSLTSPRKSLSNGAHYLSTRS